MPKRRKDEEVEWMSRKEEILNLWVEQDKPLSKVMQIMARQGFDRTKSQYERSFRGWNVSKNVFEEEWNFIFSRLDERRRPTNVKVRGVLIPQATLDRKRRRRRETTFNICKSRLHPRSRPQTPPGIEVSTPPPATEHDFQELSNKSERGEDLDERDPSAESSQQLPVQAQEDDHVLSPTVTAMTAAAVFDAGFNPHFGSNRELSTQWGRDFASGFMDVGHGNKTGDLERFLNISYHGLDKEQCQERIRQLTAGYVFAHRTDNVALKNAILDVAWRPDDVKLVMGYDYVGTYLYDALKEAVGSCDCVKVTCLIDMGASPNDPRTIDDGRALSEWDANMIRKRIAIGADDRDLASYFIDTPLKKALMNRDLRIVSWLVEAGANVNSPPRPYSQSAIEMAAGRGSAEITTYLLESGADVQGGHNRNYRRTLYWAKKNGHDSVVALLHQWKRSHYGEQDCDTVDNIMETMTSEELRGTCQSKEARMKY